jgi:hypothetical protein
VKNRPHESPRIWDRYWTTEDDGMDAEDATPEAIRECRQLVARVLQLRKASRFLAKYPRLSFRMDWIDSVFPDARFVHIMRDWRAVVASTLKRRQLRDKKSARWYGCRIPGWREMRDEAPPLVAGRQMRLATQAIESSEKSCAGRFHRMYYADLCERPVEVLRQMCEAVELRWTSEFEASLPTDLRCANYKWRESLTPEVVESIRAEDPGFYDAHTEDGS